MTDALPVSAQGLHGQVLESLGIAICGGDLPEGTVITVEDIEARYGVSRTVVREATRVLGSMGLVSMRRRVGVQVQPASAWSLFAPQVIRWRLASTARIEQIRALIEMRIAVEPEAARHAAERATLDQASELMGLAGKLWAAGTSHDAELFLQVDIQFHSLVLASSGNLMFGNLDALVGETLTGRTEIGLVPEHPHRDALQLHVDVASAIQRRDPEAARQAMYNIMLRSVQEMESVHQESARGDNEAK